MIPHIVNILFFLYFSSQRWFWEMGFFTNVSVIKALLSVNFICCKENYFLLNLKNSI